VADSFAPEVAHEGSNKANDYNYLRSYHSGDGMQIMIDFGAPLPLRYSLSDLILGAVETGSQPAVQRQVVFSLNPSSIRRII
jgi:hypothetical protein